MWCSRTATRRVGDPGLVDAVGTHPVVGVGAGCWVGFGPGGVGGGGGGLMRQGSVRAAVVVGLDERIELVLELVDAGGARSAVRIFTTSRPKPPMSANVSLLANFRPPKGAEVVKSVLARHKPERDLISASARRSNSLDVVARCGGVHGAGVAGRRCRA